MWLGFIFVIIVFFYFQGTFSLIVEAWHDTNETSRSDGESIWYLYAIMIKSAMKTLKFL